MNYIVYELYHFMLPEYGCNLASSGVREHLFSLGEGDTSSFNVPGMHFNRLRALFDRRNSCRYLHKSSSRKRLPSWRENYF